MLLQRTDQMDFGEKVYEGLPAAVGLGFALYEECGLGSMIDEAAGTHPAGCVLRPGAAVKALIGPMLASTKKIAVCRLEDFYRAAPVDKVFGDGVSRSSLNDRAVGDVLDTLASSDLQDLVWRCAARCRGRYGLASDVYHMDATNFSVYALTGTYDPEEVAVPAYGGNSKNGRNDLRQYDAQVVTDGNRTITYMRAYSGNTADTVMNADTIRFLRDRIDCSRSTVIADSKLVTRDLIDALVSEGVGFISKCPENFSESVKAVIMNSALSGTMEDSTLGEGYGTYDTEADTVCGRLRFVAYRAPADPERSLRFHREQGDRVLRRVMGPLGRERFNCVPDTEKAFRSAMRTLEDHGYDVTAEVVRYDRVLKRGRRGRPRAGDPPPETVTEYGLEISWTFDEERARRLSDEGDVRVLVTNLPFDTHRRDNLRDGATSDDVVSAYLDEYKPEHTFRLLKSGLGMSRVYLHKPSRERAMMAVLAIAAVMVEVTDAVFRERSPGTTFHNAAWRLFGASVRYKRRSDYRYVDGAEGDGAELCRLCGVLELDPDLMIGRK